MFLSFIVPVYNVEKYVGECLDSLLDQDIPKEEYEIICVNDGSTDGSLEILRQYEAANSNIRVIDKENGGVCTARNTGMDAARGEFVWFVDSDDFVQRNSLKKIREAATNREIIDLGGYHFQNKLSEEEKHNAAQGKLTPNSYANHVYVTRSVFQREFLLRYGIRFDETLSYSEDSVFACACLIHYPKRVRLNIVGYYLRYRTGSATSTGGEIASEKKLTSWTHAAIHFRELYEVCAPEYKGLIADLLMANLWFALNGIVNASPTVGRKTMDNLKKYRLYPYARPMECTITRSYHTTRTDIVGKIFDKIYIHQHRPWGFAAMILWQKLWSLKNKRG